jgi:hypothetical protein
MTISQSTKLYASFFLFILLLVASGCQTIKIENRKYKTSTATTELGSIGTSKSMYNTDNDFFPRTFPDLKNKIRLDIQVYPFNKSINNIYVKKGITNQAQSKISYIDSLPSKPEFVTVSLMDINTFTNELNAPDNRGIFTFIKDIEKASIVTSVAVALSSEDLTKIRQADAYYLINNQNKKYTIALFKQGKKIEQIDLSSGTILAYTLGKFCWSVNDRQQWYIADIVNDSKSCPGNTISKIKEKEQTNLFKM